MVRFKNRYIVCEYRFESESKNLVFSGAKLKQVLLNSIRQNYGDLGMGLVQASLAVVYLNDKTKLAIVRVPRSAWQMVWGSLTFATTVDSVRVTFTSVHVGGTIRSCQQRLVALGVEAGLLPQCSPNE